MKPEDQDKIKKLEAQVAELMEFMKQKKENQISTPLDYPSQQIIRSNVLMIGGEKNADTAPFTNNWLLPVVVNNKVYNLLGTDETP